MLTRAFRFPSEELSFGLSHCFPLNGYVFSDELCQLFDIEVIPCFLFLPSFR